MTASGRNWCRSAAGLAYPIRDGVPIMLAGEARTLTRRRTRHEPAQCTQWPTELRLNPAQGPADRRFDDGARYALAPNICGWNRPAPKCAAMAAAPRLAVTGKEHVKIARLEPVGNYAVRIVFDDGHDSGLYSWDFLAELGRGTGDEPKRRRHERSAAAPAHQPGRKAPRGKRVAVDQGPGLRPLHRFLSRRADRLLADVRAAAGGVVPDASI